MRGKQLLFKFITALDRVGVHALPKHFYTPLPDLDWLDKNRELWIEPSSLTGIPWDLEAQFAWLKDACGPFYSEVAGLQAYYSSLKCGWGLGYGPIESQVLHCCIRRFAPARVIEIGSGATTKCMLDAAELNQREGKTVPKITCVEPFPSAPLRASKDIELIPNLCQQVPPTLFDGLSAGDLLFIDSTHAVKVGSDVLRIYLEIIPRLPSGILIHIHDVSLPYAYPRNVFSRPFWWQETALLMALLINNPKLSVLTCLSALHYGYTNQLRKLLTDYLPATNSEGLEVDASPTTHFPSSLWLRTV